MPVRFDTIEQLLFAIMNEIGLSTGPDQIVFDQDTRIAITCGGKHIKASLDPNRPVFGSEFIAVLDPLNFTIMNRLFSYYASKAEAEGEFKVNAFSYQDNGIRGSLNKSNIRVKFSDNSVMESGYYGLKALKFCDIILRLGGKNPDLSNFDRTEENEM